jgi:peptide/nickel transport system ATP-binding protein
MTLLDVRDLSVTYRDGDSLVPAVRGVSFTLDRGETLGVAGESGSGKSTMVLSLLRLLPKSAKVTGQVLYEGEDLLAAKWSALRTVRWNGASVVFQGAMSALNPVRPIGEQICEPILLHEKVSPRTARERAAELLDSVGISRRRMGSYPHEFSGGQRQRIMIAMALACRPDLIIADEPTTALDVMVQAQIMELFTELVRNSGVGVIMISHDLSVLSEMCGRLAVMYAGEIVETAPVAELFAHPSHPYTRGLLSCIPVRGKTLPGSRLQAIPGVVPSLIGSVSGCAFANRCTEVREACAQTPPQVQLDAQHAVRCVAAAQPSHLFSEAA